MSSEKKVKTKKIKKPTWSSIVERTTSVEEKKEEVEPVATDKSTITEALKIINGKIDNITDTETTVTDNNIKSVVIKNIDPNDEYYEEEEDIFNSNYVVHEEQPIEYDDEYDEEYDDTYYKDSIAYNPILY